MTISKEVFCEIMVIAYRINDVHPDWSMDKCIEQAVKGAYALITIEKQTMPEDSLTGKHGEAIAPSLVGGSTPPPRIQINRNKEMQNK